MNNKSFIWPLADWEFVQVLLSVKARLCVCVCVGIQKMFAGVHNF